MISPAKINLGLEIPFKRPDGFHEIRSIFLKISWGDDIEIEPADNGVFELFSENEIILEKRKLYDQVSEIGDIKKNILYKTFMKARSLFPELPGVKIHLTKRISPAGGLGGGSTNAASLLNFLFSWRSFFTSDEMRALAAEIGSDVPFFLGEGHAFVTGKGEVSEEIEVHPGQGILALTPQVMNTAEMYTLLKKPLQESASQKNGNTLSESLISVLKNGDWSTLQGRLLNDFEPVAFQLHPELGVLKDKFLEFGSSYCSLTGSGSSMYGLVQGLEIQEELLHRLRQEFSNLTFVRFNF
ncbi:MULTISPECIES: 4-(cytidine 5'-diphospho)-2-C-methyl-D-erythritol kinase [Leptospira]|uniref:4-diphosphocytidyl-2-C-methyl-D-erythritol kinase n=4 Tax=Leptospira weilii TaxID=28184 RepID=A0A828YY80_9LEPT|nr:MULTISPECIES: 4-(cytidine 5'-diphospho)-2-C-methyl-D-erythritol kinase [Leptospira]EMM72225.1 4-(cytidine 5'-diphospho)-2-C-methyl-D-erythritol kinase [Leptospira weilii str. 2006001855]EMY16405.1 4-(cytidine 5'-diphospho)-2-C-methyl-D-erythritol kinase [Leptospira weilii str. Ecochallenge]EKR63513.1 4-(cytidine 5'-diphospho)-2-C-methyl-D-erythritol kinase [Leptospira weilii str. 2006001853]EMJ65166.1 4-(cytidine 5'-diphospho)-2-C-methyl-D-erythritol kinase [Leptospira sp. P2653]EMN46245.1 